MNTYQSVLFLIFSIIGIMMVIDNNVSVYITLIFKLIKVNTERLFWMIRFHPNNFVTTWIRNREYDRIAKELEKEFSQK
jgi:hypothetical protein